MAKNKELVDYEDMIFKGKVIPRSDKEKLKYFREELDEDEGETFEFHAPKIPIGIYMQMLAFFDWCQKVKKSEGMLHLLLPQDNKWRLACAPQDVSMASVDAHPEKAPAGEFSYCVGDAHSHPGMGAFHSGTDDLDERKHRHGIYMVFASDNDFGYTPFTTTVNIVGYMKGKRFEVDPSDVFDFSGQIPKNVSFPEEWKKRVRKSKTWTGKIKTMFGYATPGDAEEELLTQEDVDRDLDTSRRSLQDMGVREDPEIWG